MLHAYSSQTFSLYITLVETVVIIYFTLVLHCQLWLETQFVAHTPNECTINFWSCIRTVYGKSE